MQARSLGRSPLLQRRLDTATMASLLHHPQPARILYLSDVGVARAGLNWGTAKARKTLFGEPLN
jgi:hypothetical protein